MAPTTRSEAAKARAPSPDVHLSDIETDASSTTSSIKSFDHAPPVYTVDLSLPPAQRYVQVATDHKLIIEDLTKIFDELLETAKLPKKLFHLIARVILRKLYSKEQTEELQGIGAVTGVPMYLLVAYNVLLDLFMGCTSGGIVVKEAEKREKKMVHFRTLDWGMPALRRAVVQYEYRERSDGPVIATSINYVGFVGVLTGVRSGLSVSLNFRPYHNNDASRWSNTKFYAHHLLVLLGFRPSISAHLRDFILPTAKERERRKEESERLGKSKESPPTPPITYDHRTLAAIARDFPSSPTTAAYLIFCNGTQTLVLEKDRITAKPLISSSFITATNHDTSYERSSDAQSTHVAHAKMHHFGTGMEELVDESMNRKGCMVANWEKRCRNWKQTGRGRAKKEVWVGLETLKDWLLEYPVTNSETHFVTIMDPIEGRIMWIRYFEW